MKPGLYKTAKGHDVELAFSAGGHPRVTCHTCTATATVTLLWQPTMNAQEWRTLLVEFQVTHGRIEGVDETGSAVVKRDLQAVGDLLRNDKLLGKLAATIKPKEPEPFGDPWGGPDKSGNEPAVTGTPGPDPAPEEPLPEPAQVPAGDMPIPKELVARFNSLTHFPMNWEKENSAFRATTAEEEQYARDRLASYGVSTLPDDVVKALCRLREARFNMFVAGVRAREIAPPWTVVGPANYNKTFRHPERAEKVIRRALDDLEESRNRLNKVLRRYGPSQVISSDDPSAVEQLDEKIRQAERRHELMKAANAILRRAKWTKEQKLEKLWELGIARAVCEKLLQPEAGATRPGFPQYLLTNNLANIARMKARIKGIVNERAHDTKEIPFPGGRVVDSAEDNRLQIFFSDKPSPEMIKKLKSYGFHWAHSINAWQRQRTNNARYDAGHILGIKIT